jgi:hypothetical protein
MMTLASVAEALLYVLALVGVVIGVDVLFFTRTNSMKCIMPLTLRHLTATAKPAS